MKVAHTLKYVAFSKVYKYYTVVSIFFTPKFINMLDIGSLPSIIISVKGKGQTPKGDKI